MAAPIDWAEHKAIEMLLTERVKVGPGMQADLDVQSQLPFLIRAVTLSVTRQEEYGPYVHLVSFSIGHNATRGLPSSNGPSVEFLTWYPLRVEEVAQVSQRVRFIVLNSHPTDTVEVQGVARGNEEDRQL